MISFSNINKQYGKQLLFVDASFQLNPGEKVGLVGPNGAGKTTLFRMVVGEETPDEGAVSVPKKLTIGYFRQCRHTFATRLAGLGVSDRIIDQLLGHAPQGVLRFYTARVPEYLRDAINLLEKLRTAETGRSGDPAIGRTGEPLEKGPTLIN